MTSNISQPGVLLFIAALVAMLSRRLHVPYTVGLVAAGIGAYFSPLQFDIQWLTMPSRSKNLVTPAELPERA